MLKVLKKLVKYDGLSNGYIKVRNDILSKTLSKVDDASPLYQEIRSLIFDITSNKTEKGAKNGTAQTRAGTEMFNGTQAIN